MASVNALAAAAASGPSIEKGVTLDSLDARIVQYIYGKQKLQQIIRTVRQVQSQCSSKVEVTIPLVSNILALSGPIFNVNDLIFKRFEILNNGGTFNAKNVIQPPLNTNSVNFDLFENLTNYDTTKSQSLPNEKKSIASLALFQELCDNTLHIYDDKLKQALLERPAVRFPAANGSPIVFNQTKLLSTFKFPELDCIDLLVFKSEQSAPATESEINSTLQMVDLNCIDIITPMVDKCLSHLQPIVRKFESCKNRKDVESMENWDYSIHIALVVLLRLADIYAVLRKLGRRVFYRQYHYLKTLSQYYKSITPKLSVLDTNFNQQKKSNLLLASIAKLTRQGTKVQVRPETILSLGKDAKLAFQVIKEMNQSLKDISIVWGSSAEDFSQKHGTKASITALREKAKNDVLKHRQEQSRQLIEDRQHVTKKLERLYFASNSDSELKESMKEERLIREAADADAEEKSDLSRSSSVSNSSASTVTSPARLSRSSSLANRRSMIESPDGSMTRVTPASTRSNGSHRHSMIVSNNTGGFYNTPSKVNSSSSSLRSPAASISSGDSGSSGPVAAMSRVQSPHTNVISGHSNSTPLRRSASLQHNSNSRRNNNHAASGAGAAFVQKRAGPLSSVPKANSFQTSSQLSQAKIQSKVEEPLTTLKKPLTAQERLQAHIMSQSKNGQMTVKQLPDKPKIAYKSFHTNNVSSPAASIDSGSRSNSLTVHSPPLLSPASPINSRTSSLNSVDESPIRERISGAMPSSAEAGALTARMNRSRSNSLQQKEEAPFTLSPSNSVKRSSQPVRARSNSASKRPSSGITKIDEARAAGVDGSPSSTLDPNEPSSITEIGTTTTSETDQMAANDGAISPPQIITIKKVRFAGVPEYHVSEDAPSANRAVKNFRKVVFRTSSGVEVTRKKEKMLSSQEGAAFRAFKQQNDSNWEGFGTFGQPNSQVPSMRTLSQPQSNKRLSKLFKSR